MSADKILIFYCQLCEKTWDQLPEGAIRLTNLKGRGHGLTNTYRFSDRTIHIITKKAQRAEEK